MAGAEAEGGQAGANVNKAVVVVGDSQLAGVLLSVAVRVAYQRSLYQC